MYWNRHSLYYINSTSGYWAAILDPAADCRRAGKGEILKKK
jgi:hypothetical protein